MLVSSNTKVLRACKCLHGLVELQVDRIGRERQMRCFETDTHAERFAALLCLLHVRRVDLRVPITTHRPNGLVIGKQKNNIRP